MMEDTQILNDDLQKVLEHAKKQAGVNDVMRFHQDYVDRVSRNRLVLRTQYLRSILITTSSTRGAVTRNHG